MSLQVHITFLSQLAVYCISPASDRAREPSSAHRIIRFPHTPDPKTILAYDKRLRRLGNGQDRLQ